VAHRIRLRTLRAVLALRPEWLRRRWASTPSEGGWPAAFQPLDRALAQTSATVDEFDAGRFEFLGLALDLGNPIDWTPRDAPQLWRYHLHYWEWAWSLVEHPDRSAAQAQFARLWASWQRGTTFGRWDEWSPFVVSLRTWVLCGVFGPLASGTPLAPSLLADIALHREFVAHNLELDVGGNHLVKNLKALIGGAVFMHDRPKIDEGRRRLASQLTVQVLDDGGHYERSPSYHAQVLGDLVDVAHLLAAAGEPPVRGLDDAIASMRRWLSAILMPDGEVPVMNDAEYVGSRRLAALGVAASPSEGLTLLTDSGYAVLRRDRIHLLVDVGPPCPPELPAHAQADCLSFELAVDGVRLIVDPGTSTYAPGPRRAWERSTAAHNTVAIDGEDQTEVWGAFRAARLATPLLDESGVDAKTVAVQASHDGYERLAGRPRHRRTWRLTTDRLVIDDEITGTGRHQLIGRLQFAPEVPVILENRTVSAGSASITFEAPGAEIRLLPPDAEPGGVATGFGHPRPAAAVQVAMNVDLPVRWSTTIDVAADRSN